METDSSGRVSRVVVLLAVAAFLIEWLPGVLGPYGFFIDELYYLACARRPAWGYVDHPPLSIGVLAVVRAVAGEGLAVVRLVPALLAGGLVCAVGWLARRLGGGGFGQTLAALAWMLSPIPLIVLGAYSMNALEIVLWTAAMVVLWRVVEEDRPRGWIVVGVLLGLGLMNKHTTGALGAALGIGVLLSPARRQLATPWPWIAVGTAGLMVLPNLLWQQAHGWPSLEFYRNADLHKNVPTPPLTALAQQGMFYGPATFALAVVGVGVWLRRRGGQALGWAALGLLVAMVFSNKSRPDRVAGLYPVLVAAGAVAVEAFTRRPRWGWLRPALLVVIALGGLAFLPISVPLLPPEPLARFTAAAGIVPQVESGVGKAVVLPQWFADRLGWEDFARDVAAAVETLEPGERDRAVISVPSYGHHGAIERFGDDDLPPVLTPQNTGWLWGQEELARRDVETAIVVGVSQEDLQEAWDEVELVGVHHCGFATPWRAELEIHRVRGPRVPLAEMWERARHYE